MTNYVLHAEPARILTTPYGFHHRAKEFLSASEYLRATTPHYSAVSAFLACRVCELAFKAYLLALGKTMTEVKSHKHNLKSLLRDCVEMGIDRLVDLSPAERAFLRDANGDYCGQTLAYFDVTSTVAPGKPAPDVDKLSVIANKLVTATEQFCLKARNGDSNQPPLR